MSGIFFLFKSTLKLDYLPLTGHFMYIRNLYLEIIPQIGILCGFLCIKLKSIS